MTSFVPLVAAIQRATIALWAGSAILAAGDASSPAHPALLPDRRRFLAGSQAGLPLRGPRQGASACLRRLRPRGRAPLESRPLGGRACDLARPFPAVHGQVRALLVPALGNRRRRG